MKEEVIIDEWSFQDLIVGDTLIYKETGDLWFDYRIVGVYDFKFLVDTIGRRRKFRGDTNLIPKSYFHSSRYILKRKMEVTPVQEIEWV